MCHGFHFWSKLSTEERPERNRIMSFSSVANSENMVSARENRHFLVKVREFNFTVATSSDNECCLQRSSYYGQFIDQCPLYVADCDKRFRPSRIVEAWRLNLNRCSADFESLPTRLRCFLRAVSRLTNWRLHTNCFSESSKLLLKKVCQAKKARAKKWPFFSHLIQRTKG